MSLVARIAGGPAGKPPQDGHWTRQAFGAAESATGRWVDVEGSLGLTPVYSAIRLLADSVGSLPCYVYAGRGGSRERARLEQTDNLLGVEPNPEMSASDLWRLVTAHLNGWGDAFLGKEAGRYGTVRALWPIRPDRVDVSRQKGRKTFYVRDENGMPQNNGRPYTSDDVIHIQGLSLDGLRGFSPIAMAREAIGHGLALEEYANRYFSNGAVPRVVLKHPGQLSDEAQGRLKSTWRKRYGGLRNAHETAVLEEGMDVHTLTMAFEDAQFVEQQNFSVSQVARIFRIPPSMIGGAAGDNSLTYRTVEGDALAFVKWSLRPWLVTIEQALGRDRDLFATRSRYPEFLVDALLRADLKTRADAYTLALNPLTGWMTRGEVRDRENLEPETGHESGRVPRRDVLPA